MTKTRAASIVGLFPALLLLAGPTACSSSNGVPAVSGPTAEKLELAAGEMRYTPSSIAVGHGEVSVVLRNDGKVIHDLRVEGKPRLYVEAAPGQTSTTTWQLDKGRYRIFCSVAGHRAAGMEGLLEVR